MFISAGRGYHVNEFPPSNPFCENTANVVTSTTTVSGEITGTEYKLLYACDGIDPFWGRSRAGHFYKVRNTLSERQSVEMSTCYPNTNYDTALYGA